MFLSCLFLKCSRRFTCITLDDVHAKIDKSVKHARCCTNKSCRKFVIASDWRMNFPEEDETREYFGEQLKNVGFNNFSMKVEKDPSRTYFFVSL